MSTDSLTELLHDIATEGEVPAKAIAAGMGKHYKTMMRELNEFDEGAKIGVDALLPFMLAAKSSVPLEFLAGHMGYRLVPISSSVQDEGKSLEEELLDNLPHYTAWQEALRSVFTSYERVNQIRQAIDAELDQDFIAWRKLKEEHEAAQRQKKPVRAIGG
jgi:hypothetical protein